MQGFPSLPRQENIEHDESYDSEQLPSIHASQSYFEDQIVNKKCNSPIFIVDHDHDHFSQSSCLPSVSGTETFSIDQGHLF